ncbi:MAG: nucleotidyltransferase domain-containing protein [Bacteroidetes bacterium]|nr:nucleotidyltransferase domain-containing protein [Bacteroidota bacterium]MBU1679970.1 nucleotidyltransferase domain-containing protein [Bacteroidota bacterium]MBU2505974.1 nucleotidyltransferase domain-containing protein [Bacteroidota bacterium]
MDKAEAINKAIEFSNRAKQFFIFYRAVMFGSYVKGNTRLESDIDIAFFVNDYNDNLDYYNLLVNLNKLAKEIDSRIEPHIFTDNSESGFSEIILSNCEELPVVN